MNYVIKNLRILTWNIEYSNTKYDIQRKIINREIDDSVDIIALQEAVKTDIYDTRNYNKIISKSGKEFMTIFIKKSINYDNIVKGEFKKGRPFILFLIKNILFINIHPNNKIYNNLPQKTMDKKDLEIIQNIVKQLNFSRLIVVGDFNRNLNYIELRNKDRDKIIAKNIVPKNIRNKIFTCCCQKTFAPRHIDNILDSYYDNFEHLSKFEHLYNCNRKSSFIGSDHSPLLGIVPHKITLKKIVNLEKNCNLLESEKKSINHIENFLNFGYSKEIVRTYDDILEKKKTNSDFLEPYVLKEEYEKMKKLYYSDKKIWKKIKKESSLFLDSVSILENIKC